MERFKTTITACVIVIRDNKILLLKRANTGWMDGYYAIPGGGVEALETPSDAAKRELLEEVGIESMSLTYAHTSVQVLSKTPLWEATVITFVCDNFTGEPSIIEPHKCDDMQWYDINALPDTIIPSARMIIDAYKAGKTYAEYGF